MKKFKVFLHAKCSRSDRDWKKAEAKFNGVKFSKTLDGAKRIARYWYKKLKFPILVEVPINKGRGGYCTWWVCDEKGGSDR